MYDKIPAGTRVRTISGQAGVVYKELPRAAASIKVAAKEAERDRTPYSVRLDKDGSFVFGLGWELTCV